MLFRRWEESMDLYKVVITAKAQEQLERYIDYIQLTLLNDQAAQNVWQDAADTGRALSVLAGSLGYCSHPMLKALGYRSISFQRHRYIMIYHINGRTAYVDAIYHQLQDYENTFADMILNE